MLYKFLKERFIPRIKREFYSPSFKINRLLLHFVYGIFGFISKRHNKKKNAILVWDIRSNSVTFDFISVIFYVLNSIRNLSISSFDVIIFIPKNTKIKPFSWNDYDKYVSSVDIKNRIQDMIIPMAHAFNCVNKIIILDDEKSVLNYISQFDVIFPRNYDPKYFYVEPIDCFKIYNKYLSKNYNTKFSYLVPSNNKSNELLELERKLNGRKYITITVRDYGFSPSRNTSQLDIDNALLIADKLKYHLILVPDETKNLSQYNIDPKIIISFSARFDIDDRINLYSNSELNLFRTSGPSFVSLFIEGTKTIIVDFCEGGPLSNEAYYKKEYNLKVGDQPFLKFGGYIFWKKKYPSYSYLDLLEKFNTL